MNIQRAVFLRSNNYSACHRFFWVLNLPNITGTDCYNGLVREVGFEPTHSHE